MRRMTNSALLVIAALWLSGCVGVGFNSSVSERPVAQAAAPRIALKAYPPAEQSQLADEIALAPVMDIWPDYVADYGMLRRAVCAAEGWRQPACRAIRRSEGQS